MRHHPFCTYRLQFLFVRPKTRKHCIFKTYWMFADCPVNRGKADFLPRTRFQYLDRHSRKYHTLPCYGVRPSSNISKIYIYLFAHPITPITFFTLPIPSYPYAGADRSTCRRVVIVDDTAEHSRTWPKSTRSKLQEYSGGMRKRHVLILSQNQSEGTLSKSKRVLEPRGCFLVMSVDKQISGGQKILSRAYHYARS